MYKKVDLRTKQVILLMMLANALIFFFGSYPAAPQIIKLIYSISLWIIVFIFPVILYKKNDFHKITRFAISSIFFITCAEVIRSAILPDTYHLGNKWLTLFGNEECMFMMLAPLFVLLGASRYSINFLKKAIWLYLILTSIAFCFGSTGITSVLWFGFIYFPYVNRKYRLLLLFALLVGIYSAFFQDNTKRTIIVVIGIVILSLYLPYKLKNCFVMKIVCYVFIIVPLISAIWMLINPTFSMFEYFRGLILNEYGNEQLATDTRSFLFYEMATDLTNNNAWIFGKGAYSAYFSEYFYNLGEADFYLRISSEVTLLANLLRGGIVYTIAYYLLLIPIIIIGIKRSKNAFMRSICIIGAGWIMVSSISYLSGCGFRNLSFFLLMGCCASKRWLNYSDNQIKEILS